MNGETAAYPVHNCNYYGTEVWSNSKDYTTTHCGICGKITHFRWKSFWRQIKEWVNSNHIFRTLRIVMMTCIFIYALGVTYTVLCMRLACEEARSEFVIPSDMKPDMIVR